MRILFLALILLNAGYYYIASVVGDAGVVTRNVRQSEAAANVTQLVVSTKPVEPKKENAKSIGKSNMAKGAANKATLVKPSVVVTKKSQTTPVPEKVTSPARVAPVSSKINVPKPIPDVTSRTKRVSTIPQVAKRISPVSCYTLGPVSSLKALKPLMALLSHRASQVRRRIAPGKMIESFWVYMKPYRNYREAKYELSRLRARHVQHNFIVMSGQYRNGISLGLYRDLSDARRRLHAMRRKGFAASLKIKRENQQVYWIDYQGRRSEVPIDMYEFNRLDNRDHLKQMPRSCAMQTK